MYVCTYVSCANDSASAMRRHSRHKLRAVHKIEVAENPCRAPVRICEFFHTRVVTIEVRYSQQTIHFGLCTARRSYLKGISAKIEL
jgi:hypothetical protein